MRRITLVLTVAVTIALVLGLGAGSAALAAKTTSPSKATTIHCKEGGDPSCQGTSGPDIIYGSDGDDNIDPAGGNDQVYAGAGNDTVRHSYGDDYIEGGPGADTLRGGFGHDKIYDNKPGQGDGRHDLLDCAYLGSRKDTGPDEGFGEQTDTVVDCSNRDDQ